MDRASRPDGRSADDDVRLQPGEADEICSWLSDADVDRRNESLDRIGGDEELLLTLQLSDFADRDWQPVAQELARYGLAVITSWIRTRKITSKVKARTGNGLPPLPDWLTDDKDVVDGLATDVVIDALAYFKDKVLRAGKWDPTKGASLRTYFIGQCLYKYPNQHRQLWEKERSRRKHETLADDETLAMFSSSIDGTEDTAVASSEVQRAMRAVSQPRTRHAIWLHAEGHTYQQIAEQLGIEGGAKTVENMISYARKQARKTA